MYLEEKDIDAIRDYWKNALGKAERRALEQRMATDLGFREVVESQGLLLRAVETQADDALRALLQDLHQQMEAQPPETLATPLRPTVSDPAAKMSWWKKTVRNRLLWAILALCPIIWFFFASKGNSPANNGQPPAPSDQTQPGNQWKNNSAPDEHKQNTQPKDNHSKPSTPHPGKNGKPEPPQAAIYAGLSNGNFRNTKFVRVRDTTQSPYQTALTYWDAGQYPNAAKILKKGNIQQLNEESLKLLAHATFRMGRYQEAADCFGQLARKSRVEKKDALWNQLMCYGALLPESRAQFDALAKAIGPTPEETAIIDQFKLDLQK